MDRTATITIRTDIEKKNSVKNLCSDFGLSISDAVNIFFDEFIQNKSLPFKNKKPKLNKAWEQIISEGKHYEDNPHLYKHYDDLDDFFKDLYDKTEV